MFHLTDPQRETLRLRLNARSGVLREEIARALHGSSSSVELAIPVGRPERGDEAVEDLEAGIAIAGVERDADELNAILEALARMESGRYGLCDDCRAPIAYERLLAQPQASRCMRCETERERLRARPSLTAL
jgi:RNA polymerase-binding transcription factor DksA